MLYSINMTLYVYDVPIIFESVCQVSYSVILVDNFIWISMALPTIQYVDSPVPIW